MIRSLLTSILLLAGAAQAEAPLLTAQSEQVLVKIPGPEWGASAEKSVQSGTSGQGKPVLISEYIPKGQSFDAWQDLFAVMIEEDVSVTLDQYVQQQIGRFVGGCVLNPAHVFHYETPADHKIFVVPCKRYKASPETGEVAIFFVAKVRTHIVKIYQHFRGPAFTARKPETWPAETEDLNRFLSALSKLQISVSR